MHGLALFQGVELHGTCADNLENDRNGAGFAAKPGDGQGDALPLFIHAQNDELPRFGFSRDERRLHFHERDGWIEFFFSNDLIHTFMPHTGYFVSHKL